MTEKVALIDADSLMYYEMGKDTLEEAIEGLNNRINIILNETNTTTYAGFLTLSKCFRYDIAKTRDYKGNRKHGAKPPIFYALKAYLQGEPHNFTAVSGLEADDCVAIHKTELGNNSIICSPDKDVLRQIPGKHFDYNKMIWINTSKDDADRFLWIQTLMGDPTDGIPGLPKVGEKTAIKILNENPKMLEHYQLVIEKYVEKFGIFEGMCKFAETFHLVFMLRTREEAAAYTVEVPDIVLTKLITKDDDWY